MGRHAAARTSRRDEKQKAPRTSANRHAEDDDYGVTVPTQQTARVPGGDHLLLAAFPLAVARPGRAGVRLREQLLPGKPYKVIQDRIRCPVTSRTVTRTLEVYGGKGAIQPSDEDVLIALIQFTHEYLASSPAATLIITDQEILRAGGDPTTVMMRLRKIHFKRADLLKRLGITNLSGKNQQLIEQRMHRLSGVDLAVRNAYFQADGTLITSVGLRLIDSYAFAEGNRYAWFAWSPTMAQLIENGELRALDTDFYFRIQDFLARRLFRHLNIFGKPGRTIYPFAEIVKTRLGLEPSTEYVSKCKDPVERACRELVRLGFLKSYAIDGKFVSDATIAIEMPADYQPSETFTLPFEAIIDSFRKDADASEATEPVARGGLWREESERLKRFAGRSTKTRQAAAELARAVFDRFGPSASTLQQAIQVVEVLGECGIRPHTAIPEAVRLVETGGLTEAGLATPNRRAIEWWQRKRDDGEKVGPGLLVAALRDPELATDADLEPAERPQDVVPVDAPSPHASDDAAAAWMPIREAIRARFDIASIRDWLDPIVPVALLVRATDDSGGATGELTLWVPNTTFREYLCGNSAVAQALRNEAAARSIAKLAFAVDA
jgi:hypothetical protein